LLKESTIQSFNDCYGSLNSETQETITRIIEDNYFKSHAIGILTKDGDMIPLQTGDETYSPGSSVSHINNPLYDEAAKAISEGRMEYLFSSILLLENLIRKRFHSFMMVIIYYTLLKITI